MIKFLKWIFVLAIVATAIFGWLALGKGTAFAEKNKYFVIEEGKTDKASIIELLEKKYIIKHGAVFSLLATQLNVWDKVKAGKFEVKNGESLLNIARMLKNNKQAEMSLIINKLRIKEDLAKLISKNFAPDSTTVMQFLNSNDSLKQFDVDTNTVFTSIIPDKYNFYWNTSLQTIFEKLTFSKNNFWQKNGRTEKANAQGLTPIQAYILASIVEEESNLDSEKPTVASVYINRLNIQMPLQADPTIKFAMKNFTLTRIYEKYLFTPSAYNTYRNKGLPPGPICTPSIKSIDAVLNAPKTDYIYFVASANLDGKHRFSSSNAEHLKYAAEYHKAITEYFAKKNKE